MAKESVVKVKAVIVFGVTLANTHGAAAFIDWFPWLAITIVGVLEVSALVVMGFNRHASSE